MRLFLSNLRSSYQKRFSPSASSSASSETACVCDALANPPKVETRQRPIPLFVFPLERALPVTTRLSSSQPVSSLRRVWETLSRHGPHLTAICAETKPFCVYRRGVCSLSTESPWEGASFPSAQTAEVTRLSLNSRSEPPRQLRADSHNLTQKRVHDILRRM